MKQICSFPNAVDVKVVALDIETSAAVRFDSLSKLPPPPPPLCPGDPRCRPDQTAPEAAPAPPGAPAGVTVFANARINKTTS